MCRDGDGERDRKKLSVTVAQGGRQRVRSHADSWLFTNERRTQPHAPALNMNPDVGE